MGGLAQQTQHQQFKRFDTPYNNYQQQQQQQQQQQYNKNFNPNFTPNPNPNTILNPTNPYQHINDNNNFKNNNDIDTSQIPFLPQTPLSPQQQNPKSFDNDEFAIDRFSRNFYNQQPQ